MQDEHPRRRAEDREEDALDTPTEGPSLMERSRKLARQFRTPLIGLGVAGVAMPFANELDSVAGAHREASGEADTHKVAEAERAQPAQQGSKQAREDQLGQQWASLKRDNIVTSAMKIFGIDRTLAEQIHDIAQEEGIDPNLGFGLVKTESTFNNRAKSYVGALGLTQLMPRTAAWLRPGTSRSDLTDPQLNLRLGFKYLRQLQEKYRGDTKLALLAYNRGPGIVDRYLKRGADPDNGYADKVLGGAKQVQNHKSS